MSKHYRQVAIEDVSLAALATAGKEIPLAQRAHPLKTPASVRQWLDTRGPVHLRVELRHVRRVNPTTGEYSEEGARDGVRLDVAITGHDSKRQQYRALFPFGVAWGQGGRCWLSPELLGYWLSNRRGSATGVVFRAGIHTAMTPAADRSARAIELE